MRVCLTVSLLLAAACALAQNDTRIDGRQHPELIPDNAAYRAVFLMHSHSATPEESARSEQFHSMIGFTTDDHRIYDEALKNFRQQYEAVTMAHDAFVDASTASASIADLQKEVSDTRQAISKLVDATRAQLATSMTKMGFATLDAFVHAEKTRMVVGVRSAQ